MDVDVDLNFTIKRNNNINIQVFIIHAGEKSKSESKDIIDEYSKKNDGNSIVIFYTSGKFFIENNPEILNIKRSSIFDSDIDRITKWLEPFIDYCVTNKLPFTTDVLSIKGFTNTLKI